MGGNLGSVLPVGRINIISELFDMGYHPRHGVMERRTNMDIALLNLERRRGLCSNDESTWKVEFIREPLKCRVITRGEFRLNAAWSDIQKKLWRRLQEFECFKLTHGHQLNNDDLDRLRFERTGGFWVSGDYSAATDSIHQSVMEAALHGISDPLITSLIQRNLSRGIITYDHLRNRINCPVPEPVKQNRGQLMGSMFSFPILCIINLATYLYTVIRHYCCDTNDLLTLVQTANVLINGDDILFYSPSQRFYQSWEYNSSCAGFSLSVGKNYTSRRLALVNSRYYDVRGDEPVGPIPYINMGLVNGVQKGESDEILRSYREKMCRLPGYFRDMWKDFSPKEDQLRTRIENYIWHHRADVRRAPFSLYTMGLARDVQGVKELSRTTTDILRRNKRNLKWTLDLPSRFHLPTDERLFWKHSALPNTDILRIPNIPQERFGKDSLGSVRIPEIPRMISFMIKNARFKSRDLSTVVREFRERRVGLPKHPFLE
jgi:hypothetical protein